MNLQLNWPWTAPRIAARALWPSAPDWVNATLIEVPAEEPVGPAGCGRFDSSRELNASW